MPTNDERREVAARLRANEYGLEYFTLMAILGFDRDAEPYFDGYHRCPERLNEDMRLRLADLIEPEPERTCQIDDSGYCVCGYPLGDWVTWRMDDRKALLYERANYCPNCGCRVKETK